MQIIRTFRYVSLAERAFVVSNRFESQRRIVGFRQPFSQVINIFGQLDRL